MTNQVLALHTTVNSRFLAMNIASRCNVFHYKYSELKLQHRASRNAKSCSYACGIECLGWIVFSFSHDFAEENTSNY